MAISFVGVGAAAAADNASLTPALPTFAQDDLFVALLIIRGSGTANFATPAGWTSRFNVGAVTAKLQVFTRPAVTGDTAPTFTLSGGAAGDTVIGQIASFRGVDLTAPIDTNSTYSATPATQNLGPVAGFTPTADNVAVLVCAMRRDDWTSVATLTGDSLTWAEIGEPDTQLGNDAGLVWNYTLISGGPVAISDKTFTIIGGSALSGGGIMFSLKPMIPDQDIGPATGISSGEMWGSGQVTSVAQVTAPGIPSAEAWGLGVVGNPIRADGIPSAEAWGTGIVTPGPAEVAAASITSDETWGSGLFANVVAAASITSDEAWGSGQAAPGAVTILGQGIPSAEAWGSGALHHYIFGVGIESAEAWGDGTITTLDDAEARRRERVAAGAEFENDPLRRFRLVSDSEGSFAYGPLGQLFDYDAELREGDIQTADDNVAEGLEGVGAFTEIEPALVA